MSGLLRLRDLLSAVNKISAESGYCLSVFGSKAYFNGISGKNSLE